MLYNKITKKRILIKKIKKAFNISKYLFLFLLNEFSNVKRIFSQ